MYTPAQPSNNPPCTLYPKPSSLINPTQFYFSPHPKNSQLIYFKIFAPLNDLPPSLLLTSPFTLNPSSLQSSTSNTSSTLFLKEKKSTQCIL